jgi:hypothetical protein
VKNQLVSVVVHLLFCSLGWGQQLPDANYLIPVDHRLNLPPLENPWIGFPAESILVEGAYYNGYQIVDAYDERTYIYTTKDIKVGNDGFLYANASYDKINEPFLVLTGGDILLHFSHEYYSKPKKYFGGQEARMGSFLVGGPEWAYKRFSMGLSERYERWKSAGSGLWDDGLNSIKVWSTLTEMAKGEEISYGPERMRHPFYDWGDMKINFNNASLFWAEGEPGPGIGGTIEIELSRESDHLMLLNGAVDLSRRYLYKANNRLKRVLIESIEPAFTMEYVFEDVVQFHKISFPQKTRKVILTIKEVYKGEKWDDTCISAIFLKQEELRPRSEYEQVIEAYVKRKGFDKLIEEYKARRLEPITR